MSQAGDSESPFPRRWVVAWTLVACAWQAHLLWGLGRISESDEAVVALMARAIAHGEDHPAFYWGQSYMGSVEAWLAAPLFWLFGTSMPLLRALISAFTVGLVPLAARLGQRAGGARMAMAAAVTFACPPVLFSIWSTKPRGGFTDVIAVGIGVTWLFLRIAEGATERSQRGRAFLAGLGLGLVGWWNLFGLPFALPGVLLALFDRRTRRPWLWAMGIVGGLLGGSVLLVSNARNDWATFRHTLAPTEAQRRTGQPVRADPLKAQQHLLEIGLPASLGIGDQRNAPRPLGPLGWGLAVAATLGLIAALVQVLRRRTVRDAITVLGPALGSIALAQAFVFSRFGCEPDPRYLLGLWPGLAWCWAWLLTTVAARTVPVALGLGFALIGYQFQQVHLAQTPVEHWLWRRDTAPTLTLKPITDALLSKGIHAAYADYWTAERLTLDSDGAFLAVDPRSSRYPPRLEEVDRQSRRCWISVPWGDAPTHITRKEAVEVLRVERDDAAGIGEPLVVACSPAH